MHSKRKRKRRAGRCLYWAGTLGSPPSSSSVLLGTQKLEEQTTFGFTAETRAALDTITLWETFREVTCLPNFGLRTGTALACVGIAGLARGRLALSNEEYIRPGYPN